MSDFAALAYLQWRQTVNALKNAMRQPARAIMYLFLFAYLAFTIWIRTGSRIRFDHPVVPHLPDPYATALFFACCALLGGLLITAVTGNVGGFSSPADARFLIGSRLSPRIVTVWLQLRRHAAGLLRMGLAVIFYAGIYGGAVRFGGIAPLILAGTVLWLALSLPALHLSVKMGRGSAAAPFIAILVIGSLLAFATAGSVLYHPLAPIGAWLERLRAGSVMNALLRGDARGLEWLWLTTGAIAVACFFAGHDLYPELYATSLRMYAFRERRRRGARFQPRYEAGPRPIPQIQSSAFRGAGAILWKELVGFARSPSMQRTFGIFFILCAVGGFGLGSYSLTQRHPEDAAIAFGVSAANIVLIFSMLMSAISLRDDLSRPLWWMGRDPLWARLCVWLVGASWRIAVLAAVAIGALTIGTHLPELAIAGIPLAIVLIAYVYAIALALYSIFPAGMDQRGPLAMVRLFLCYSLLMPVATSGVLVAVFLRSPFLGIAAGGATCIAESLALIAFAAWRIESRGITLAQAETI
jgi:hypothetical protein